MQSTIPAPEPVSCPRHRKGIWLGFALAIFAVAGSEWAVRGWLGENFCPGEPIAREWNICGQFDARLGWSNRPNSHARIADGPLDYRVSINSLGWRDRERAVPREDRKARILALGDSMTWGWGVAAEARFSDLLDQRLSADAEVWNTSTPGWGTDQEYWALQDRLLALEPDIVVLGVVFNDLQDIGSGVRYDMHKPLLVADEAGDWKVSSLPLEDPRNLFVRVATSLRRDLRAHSALASVVLSGGNPLRFSFKQRGIRWQDFPIDARELRPRERELYERRCEGLVDPSSAMHALLKRFRSSCEAIGCDLLVITLVHQHDLYLLDPRYPRPALDADGRSKSTLARRLHEAGEQLGIEVVDFEQQFLEHTSAGEFLDCGDSHFNEQGHRIVADALEPRLRELLARRAIDPRTPKRPPH